MLAPSSSERLARSAVLVVAAVVLTGAVVGTVAAATTTAVGVAPASDSLEPGEETVVEVVVEDADGGVGAVNATVTFSDPTVVAVEDVTLHGEPRLTDVTHREDGVELSAALADTEDSGRVTVATVVVRAEDSGETAVDVTVRALGDEDGAKYSVESVDRPTLSVAGGSDTDGGSGDGGSGDGGDQSDTSDTDDGGDADARDSNDGDTTGGDERDANGADDQSTSSDTPREGSDEDGDRDGTTSAAGADGPDEGDSQAADGDGRSSDSSAADSPRNDTGGPAGGVPIPVDAVLAAGAVVVVGAAGGFLLYRFG